MIFKNAKTIYYNGIKRKRIYLGNKLIYASITPPPPTVSESDIVGQSSAEDYVDGSTSWGNLTLSSGCSTSKDGIEIQGEETYISSRISNLSYPMSFEFKGRIDSSCYKAQANNPGMIFGIGPTRNGWGDGITCYSTTEYGIIIDTTRAMTIVTNKTPNYAHIIFKVNSSGKLTMYLNGINNSWTTNSNSAITSRKSYIFNGQGAGRFIGAINTMRWWDIELSTSDIETLFSKDSSEYSL